ncbi:MAG: ABC transporter permease [Bryobacterales bacterium]|nr:ABC transporter permease [Bryobacterales bacterium]
MFWNKKRSAEIEEELAAHIEALEARFIEEGMTPAEARRQARIQFGPVARIREEVRETHTVPALETMLREVRWSLRALRRRPGFAAAAVLAIGLGIGATASLYSVVDAFFLKALPLPAPEQVVAVNTSRNGRGQGGNPARLQDVGKGVPGLSAVAGYYSEGLVWERGDSPVQVRVLRYFGDWFGVISASPVEGRAFTVEEAKGADTVAIATAAFRRQYLGGVSLPHMARINGKSYQIIGVLPDSAGYPELIDLIMPGPASLQTDYRVAAYSRDIGRVRPGVALSQVQAQLEAVMAQLKGSYPATDSDLRMSVRPLLEDETRQVRGPVYAVFGAGLLILLIACVSVSSLLLSRAAERTQEASIRLSLGASRGALLRLYVVEAVVLASAGGLLGLGLAWYGVDWLKAVVPADLPMQSRIALDWRVVRFAALASLVAGLLCSLSPAWFAWRSARLQASTRVTSPRRARRWLTAVEVAITVPLLVAAVLLLRSFAASASTPAGVNAEHALTVTVDLPWDTPAARLRDTQARLLEHLTQQPGVRVAGVIDRLPLEGGTQARPVARRGRPAEPNEPRASLGAATPTVFEALGVPLLAGRLFHPDRREVVVNQRFADVYFDGGNPIGEAVNIEGKGDPPVWYQIVGVVGHLRETYGETLARPQVFVSTRFTYWPLLRFVLRTTENPSAMADGVRASLVRLDPALPVRRIATLEDALGRSLDEPRTVVSLMSGFAFAALVLSLIGLFGLLAADVAQRRREIGIRLALGASPGEVSRGLLRDGMRVASAGLAVGLVAAVFAARGLESLLFGVKPSDAVSFLAVLVVILVGTVGAAWVPARRASRVDPASALRSE